MNMVEMKITELKSCIGKTDTASRKKFEEAMAYLETNNSPEVQEQLNALLADGLKDTHAEVGSLKEKFSEKI